MSLGSWRCFGAILASSTFWRFASPKEKRKPPESETRLTGPKPPPGTQRHQNTYFNRIQHLGRLCWYTPDYLKIWKQEFSRVSSRGLQRENKPPKLKWSNNRQLDPQRQVFRFYSSTWCCCKLVPLLANWNKGGEILKALYSPCLQEVRYIIEIWIEALLIM